MGLARDGARKDAFARGVELRARPTLLAEGCRGSLSEVHYVCNPSQGDGLVCCACAPHCRAAVAMRCRISVSPVRVIRLWSSLRAPRCSPRASAARSVL